MFRDLDSPKVNSKVEIKMFDDYQLFSHVCTKSQFLSPDPDVKLTTFVCGKLYFKLCKHL